MSAATLNNPVTTTARQDYLRDYHIRLTGGEDSDRERQPLAPPSAENTRAPADNPPGWYNEHRQVPPYRPVNTELDRKQRPWGSNPVESAFVFTMLHGVWLTSVSDCER